MVAATYNMAKGMLFYAALVAVGLTVLTQAMSHTKPVLELSEMNGSSGMMETPMLDLSNQSVVSMVEEHLSNSVCDCTPSGYSGVLLQGNGTVMSYGNTTHVGCANHDMQGELPIASIESQQMYCYVLGGTGCANATPSVLGDKDASFTMAAYRECNPFTEKSGQLCIGVLSCQTNIGVAQGPVVIG